MAQPGSLPPAGRHGAGILGCVTSAAALPLRVDAIVVGSGAGGAPVAARLAEAGLEVLLLEAGPRLSSSDFTGDEGAMTARLYTLRLASGSGLNLYAGACVGGSTVINDALCFRTPPEILDAWRREGGLESFREESFAPFIDRAWADLAAAPTDRAHLNRNAHVLETGAARLGWAAHAMARNVRGCSNLGLCNFGCPTGAKQSTLVTYVPRAERAGARVVADTRVHHLWLEAGRVRGVEAHRLDPTTRSPREAVRVEAPLVVLAAGVLETPAILLRSGLGSAAVGRDLQFHTSLHVTGRFEEPINGYYGPTMAYAVTQFSDVNGSGGPGFMLENVAVHPIATASALPGFGEAYARAMAELPHLARALVVLRDRSRGVLGVDDDGRPGIRYVLEAYDRRRLRDGMLAIARAFLAAGALEVWLPLNGLPPLRSERDLDTLARLLFEPSAASLLYAVHLFGGAAMASSPLRGACDESGQVFGVRGLFVSDASTLPSNTGVNPQITIVANALRVAEGIVAAHPRAA